MISPLGEQFQLRFSSCYDFGTDAPSLSMLTNLGRPPWARGCGSMVRTVHRRLVSTKNVFFKVSEEVQEAVRYKRPVVALETTIYTHGGFMWANELGTHFDLYVGFPYPENVALASHLESVVRVNGGVPATIGVLNGVARVGFETEELIELTASAGKPETKKLSRRDLGYICGLVLLQHLLSKSHFPDWIN